MRPLRHCVSIWAVTVVALASTVEAETPLAEYDKIITALDREHWAYQPVRKPKLPAVSNTAWCRNPIDRFVLARLEKAGWKPATPATRRALLRRVYLDVIGIPPTLAEQEKFLADRSPGAWQRVIDDLLSRPGYGERWGRHWLDLVRYAETNGYERDAAKPHVWRYRDYIVRAFNDDKPYDRFILEQLAGDELPDRSTETVIATGYYRLGPWDDEPADPQQDRFDQLDDIVDTTSQVFLGLTMGCCRCHNHKFEALTMHDYYRMVAVFNPLKRPQNGRTELDHPAGSREEVARLVARDRRIAGLSKQFDSLRIEFRTRFLKSGKSKLPAQAIAAFLAEPAKRNGKQKELVKKHTTQLEAEVAAALTAADKRTLDERQRQIEQQRRETPDLPRGYFLEEPSPKPPKSHLLLRGRAALPGPEVNPGMPTVLAGKQPAFLPADAFTTRRRLTLARWIARPDHPLTARVIVNRVWQHHFGEGLVRSPSDFGINGYPPTHPQLLDWLAHWFVHDANWSLKRLHRLIITSSTYRMSKRWNAEYAAADAENERLWRFPYRRLEVEVIRDAMLAASGQLNREMYGESVYLYVPKEALEGHSDPGKIWKPFEAGKASRRTVYAFVKRSLVVPMLEVFDLCDTTRTADRRNVTNVAPQALTLFNGNFVNRQARHLTDRLMREVGDDPTRQIECAYLLALCRPPKPAEQTALREFLRLESTKLLKEAARSKQPLTANQARHRAVEQLCRVILNLNEFVYAD